MKDNYVKNLHQMRRRTIKKLYAAISMLLVSSLMLGMASYAWMSLSSAPEVQNIDAAVTGNGSLEIALASSDDTSNVQWGNLVDLGISDYGLSEISLYPALLNIVNDCVQPNALQTAEYGWDGRIRSLSANTTSAVYQQASRNFFVSSDTGYGVRAFGTAADTGIWSALQNSVNTAQNGMAELFANSGSNIYSYINEKISRPTDEVMPVLQELVTSICGTRVEQETLADEEEGENLESTGTVLQGGLVSELETVVRKMILACSGYSDSYVSVSSSEISELVNSGAATDTLIDQYVNRDTELYTFCMLYRSVCAKAEEAVSALKVLENQVAETASEMLSWEEISSVLTPLIGANYEMVYTCEYTRTEKINGKVTERKGTITESSTEDFANAVEELQGENVQVILGVQSQKVCIKDDDCLLSLVSSMSGTVDAAFDTTQDEESGYSFVQHLVATEPSDGSTVSKIGALQAEAVYKETLLELQTLWNELPVKRNALANALYGEMRAIEDIYQEEAYVTIYNESFGPNYEREMSAFEQYGLQGSEAYQENQSVKSTVVYQSPESAEIDTLRAHLSTMQDALKFYYEFTKYAVLTYAAKSENFDKLYPKAYELCEAQEDAKLEDIIAILGDSYKESCASAVEDYYAVQAAIEETEEKITAYEEAKAAEGEPEGSEKTVSRTYAEDVELRSAFLDIASLTSSGAITTGKTADKAVYTGHPNSSAKTSGVYDRLQSIGASADFYLETNTSDEGDTYQLGSSSQWSSILNNIYGLPDAGSDSRNLVENLIQDLEKYEASDIYANKDFITARYERYAKGMSCVHSTDITGFYEELEYMQDTIFPDVYGMITYTVKSYLLLQLGEQEREDAGDLLETCIERTLTREKCPKLSEMKAAILEALQNSENEKLQKLSTKISAAMDRNEKPIWNWIMSWVYSFERLQTEWSTAKECLDRYDEDPYYSYKVLEFFYGNRYESMYNGSGTIYLPDDSVYIHIAALFSDQLEYTRYGRENWGEKHYRYNNGREETYWYFYLCEGSNTYDSEKQPGWKLNALEIENGEQEIYTLYSYCQMYYHYRMESHEIDADNGIALLYAAATDGSDLIETDRSVLYTRLKPNLAESRKTAEDAYMLVDMDLLTSYINGTLLASDMNCVDTDGNAIELSEEQKDALFPESRSSYTKEEVRELSDVIDKLSGALNAYKDMLRLSFMIWASSSEGSEKAYNAVLKYYTDSLEILLQESGVGEENVYYVVYKKLQETQTVLKKVAENLTVADLTQAQLRSILAPLTTDYVLVVNTTAAEIKAVSLQIQDSVMGDVMSLYSTEGYMTSTTEIGEEASGTNASLTINYQSDGSDYLEKINTATDETIKTNDPNVAYNQTSSTILTSTYGFAIDLLVRTNVDDSNLLLQTDAMQRVYDGESNREDTEGSGSYCAIGGLANATDELKDALRFVFTNTKTGKILGCARIFNDSKLYLCDYTITEGGYLQVGKQSESDIIVSLERNATTPITVYVYLDGNKVTNAGAVELGKLKMKMNLQFSSDAELIPTRNEELMYQQ